MKINFKKFIEYTTSIKENQEEEFVISELIRIFAPKNTDKFIAEFVKAIEEPQPKPLPLYYKIDIGIKQAGKFIDADTFLNEDLLIEFIDTIVKHRVPFCKVNLTINHVKYLTDFFARARRK
jgi:hypothetical protein